MAEVIAAAICNGSSQQLTAAVQKFGKDINLQTTFEAYPLHLAVWRNSLSAIQQLLDAGAKTEVCDGESGWSPLHKALYQGSLTAAALLLTYGSSLDLLDNKGRLPLDLVSHGIKQQLHLAAATQTSTAARTTATNDVVGYSNLYSWGNGANFTLGTGSTDLHLTPTRVDVNHPEAAAANTSGNSSSRAAGSIGTAASVAAAAPFAGRIVALAAAKFHSAIVTDDGRLYTFGFGRGGRLGHADFHIHSGSSAQIFPRAVSGLGKRVVVAVAAAKHHTLVATSAGEVFSFGSNNHGRLGYAAVDSQPTPRKVSSLPPRARVVSVAAANKHSAAVTSSGEVFTWGANSSGQLGYGTPDSGYNPTPRMVDSLKGKTLVMVAAAKRHTVVLTADGEVYTFGHKVVTPRKVLLAGSRDTARAAPPPPAGTTSTTTASPATAAAATGAAAASSGGSAGTAGATAASSSSTVVAHDTSSAPATAASAAVPVGTEQLAFHQGVSDVVRPVAVAIAAGAAHSSALTRTGVVLVWPSAAPAPRPLEVSGPLAGKKVVCVSAGKNRTAVVTDEGHVFMWESREGKKNKKKAAGDGGQQQQQQQQQGEKGPAAAAGSGGKQEVGGVKRLGSQNAAAAAVAAAADGEGDKQQEQSAVDPLVAEKSSSSFTAGGSPVASTPAASGGSSSKILAGSSSYAKGPGSSSGIGYGSNNIGSSSSNAALKAMLKAWVGPTAPVVPLRVAGPRHVTSVAVGEKHSLAVQTWVAPVLPEDGGQYSHMLQFADGEDMGRSTGDVDSPRDYSEPYEEEVYSAAADAVAASGGSRVGQCSSSSVAGSRWLSDNASHGDPDGNYHPSGGSSSSSDVGPESLSVICERAVAQQLVEPRTAPAVLEYADVAGAHLLKAYCLSVAVHNLDMLIAEARFAFEAMPHHLLLELEQLYKQLALGEPAHQPLQELTQQAEGWPAAQPAGARSSMCFSADNRADMQQQQEVSAATVGARVPAYDLGFHFVIPGGEVFDTPEQQPQQQEQGDQQTAAAAGSVGGPPVPLQHMYKRLHHGKRPTNYPDRCTGLHLGSAAAGKSAADHGLLTAAAARGALAAVHHSWFEPDGGSQAAAVPAFGSSSFLSGDAERLTALREAAQKLHRNLLKKLQQIEALEARQSVGDILDPQQLAKVSLKGSILDALSQLRTGSTSLEDVQGLVTRAQAVAHKLYLSPAAAAGDDDITGRSLGSYGAGSVVGVLGTSPAAVAAMHMLDVEPSTAQTTAASAIAASQGHTPSSSSSTAAPAVAAAAPSAGKKGSKKAQQGLKGDLSMFLTGQLEKKAGAAAAAAAVVDATEAAAASSSREASRGPAWGGVSLHTSARPPSLREAMQADINKTPSTAAAGASTATIKQQQQPVAKAKADRSADAGAGSVFGGSSSTSSNTPSNVSAAVGAHLPATRPQQQQQPAAGGAVTTAPDTRAAGIVAPGSSSLSAPRTPRSIEHSSSSSSSSGGVTRTSSGMPPAGQHHGVPAAAAAAAAAAAVGHHHVGSVPSTTGATTAAAAGQAALGTGFKLSLMDLVAHKRSSPLTVSRTKSKTGAGAGAAPAAAVAVAAAAGPAWGGVIGSSPPGSSAVSLRDIQQEQEQLRATTGWAAYQREKAAAAAAAAATPAAGSSTAAAAPSLAIQQLRAAGGLTKALQSAAAVGSTALPAAGASPAAVAAAGSSPASGSLSVSYKGGGSSHLLHGSSPPAPSKWYVRDQPQVRSLADIQSEEQLLQEQGQLLQQLEEEKALADEQRRRQQQQQRRESRRAKLAKDVADSSRRPRGGSSTINGSGGHDVTQQPNRRAGGNVVHGGAAAAQVEQGEQQKQPRQHWQRQGQPRDQLHESGGRGRGRGQGPPSNSRSTSSRRDVGGDEAAVSASDGGAGGGAGGAAVRIVGVARPHQRHRQRHGRRTEGSDSIPRPAPAAADDDDDASYGEQASQLQQLAGKSRGHGRSEGGRSNRRGRGDGHCSITAAAAATDADIAVQGRVETISSAAAEADSQDSTSTRPGGTATPATPGSRGRGSGGRGGGRSSSNRGQGVRAGDAAAANGRDNRQQWQPVEQQASQPHGYS